MGKAKNNQAKAYFAYKNDELDLVEIGQFLRDTTNYRVEREWYVILDKFSGTYKGYSKNIPKDMICKPRNPDLILIDKDTKKLVLIIEIDGDIHRVKYADTEERNSDYEDAGLPYITVEPFEIETNIFDLVTKKVAEQLDN